VCGLKAALGRGGAEFTNGKRDAFLDGGDAKKQLRCAVSPMDAQ